MLLTARRKQPSDRGPKYRSGRSSLPSQFMPVAGIDQYPGKIMLVQALHDADDRPASLSFSRDESVDWYQLLTDVRVVSLFASLGLDDVVEDDDVAAPAR